MRGVMLSLCQSNQGSNSASVPLISICSTPVYRVRKGVREKRVGQRDKGNCLDLGKSQSDWTKKAFKNI